MLEVFSDDKKDRTHYANNIYVQKLKNWGLMILMDKIKKS